MNPVIVVSEHVGASPTVDDQASSGMKVGGASLSFRGGASLSSRDGVLLSLRDVALLSLVGGFFFFRCSKYLIRVSWVSCGFFSPTSEWTLKEDASSEEAITAKSIGANTFHHTMKNNIRI